MQKDQIAEIDCVRIESGSRSVRKERIAIESSLTLLLDGKKAASFVYSPGFERELVFGHLISSGMIKDIVDVRDFEISDSICRISQTQSTNKHKEEADKNLNQVDFKTVVDIRANLLKIQKNHRATRGFHGAIIWENSSGKWFACEDVGRHNAVDKVIGHFAVSNLSLGSSILLLSGRLTEQIVNKCMNAGIPVVASMTVATNRGIEIAKESNMTLVGALTEDACWLYNEGSVSISFA